jgi:23S rRNA pseudouridine2605 synthase
MEERLQKIIARAGLASRRRAEEMIRSGLVTVNGQTVTELGTKADIGRDHIKVAGKLLRPEAESAHVYLILNKPAEVVATMSDPEGRPSLRDFLHGVPERVFPVGRLEYHSSGLVFLTNDGDLANQMLKARNLPQVYQFKVKSLLTFAEIAELSRATGARMTRMVGKEMPWYLVTLSDARRDQLRDRLFRSGHPVEKIRRVGLGGIEVGSLAPGRYRALSGEELSNLRRAVAPGAKMAPVTAEASPAKAATQQPKSRRRPNFGRSGASRSNPGRPNTGRPNTGRPNTGRHRTGRPKPSR